MSSCVRLLVPPELPGARSSWAKGCEGGQVLAEEGVKDQKTTECQEPNR